jgi:hypothetical protein
MEIRYTTTLKDYAEANRVMHFHRGGLMRVKYQAYVQFAYVIGLIFIVVGGLLLAATIGHKLGISDEKTGFVFSMAVIGGVGWLFNPSWHERKLARIFSERNEPSECTLTADETGIASARTDGKAEARIAWSMFEKWTETESCFVLVLVGGQCIPVPKRAMSAEQQGQLRVLLGSYVAGAAVS